MQVTVEEIGTCKVALTIEIEHEAYKEAVAKATDQLLKSVSVPGFRKGRAPRQLALRYVSEDAIQKRVIANVVPDALDTALAETGLDVYDVADLGEPQFPENDEPFRFRTVVTTRPTVELAQYKGLRYELPMAQVDDAAVDQELNRILEEYRRLEDTGRPAQKGDWVTLRAVDRRAAVPERIGIADPDADSVARNLVGLSPGDTVQLQFPGLEDQAPESYQVVAVQAWTLPELTDEFLSQKLGVESVEKLREEVRRRLEDRAKALWKAEARSYVVEDVVRRSTVLYPEEMVDRMAASRTSSMIRRIEERGLTLADYLAEHKMTLRDFQEETRRAAASDLDFVLVLGAIAEAEGLSAREEESAEGGKATTNLYDITGEFLLANNEVVPVGASQHQQAERQQEQSTENQAEPETA